MRAGFIAVSIFAVIIQLSGIAQTAVPTRRDQIAQLVQSKLKANESLEFSAASSVLRGDSLLLKGDVTIVCGSDIAIWVDEVKINWPSKTVEFTGRLYASFGSKSGFTPQPRSRIEYR